MPETIDTEKMKRKLFDAVVQLDSYNTIFIKLYGIARKYIGNDTCQFACR